MPIRRVFCLHGRHTHTHTHTHYKTHTHTHTHPHITKPTHTHTLQNPHIHTPTHYKTQTYTNPHITKPKPTHTHTLHKTRYPLYRRLCWPQGRSGQLRKISPPPRFDPRTFEPVANRYTDYAIRPTICLLPEKHSRNISRYVCNLLQYFRIVVYSAISLGILNDLLWNSLGYAEPFWENTDKKVKNTATNEVSRKHFRLPLV